MKKQALDVPTIMKAMGGGALVGGGTAAGAALLRLLLNLYEDKNRENDTSLDDDVLYVNLKGTGDKEEKEAHVKEAVNSDTAVMSALGMALAAYLGYTGVNKVFNRVREKRLQKELDLAQQVYIDRVGEKTASLLEDENDPFYIKEAISKPTFAMSIVKALPLLIALGTAVGAYRLLDKHSPKPKKTSVKPKRIVLRTSKGKKERPVSDEISAEDVENLVRTTMAKESRANASGFHDLFSFIAKEGLHTTKQNFKDYGMHTTMDMAKGARFEKISSIDKNLAITAACNDGLLKEAIGLMAASEFYDMSPGFVKIAYKVPPETQELLTDLTRAILKREMSKAYSRVQAELLPIQALLDPSQSEKILELIEQSGTASELKKESTEKKAVLAELSTLFSINKMMEKNEGGDKDITTSGKLQVPSSKSSDDPKYKDIKKDKSVMLEMGDEDAEEYMEEHGDDFKDIIDQALSFEPSAEQHAQA